MDREVKNIQLVTEHAFRTYCILKEEVERWNAERGIYWKKTIYLSKTFPYCPVNSFPKQAVLELWQRLNARTEILILESDIVEMWENYRRGQPLSNPKLLSTFNMTLRGIAQLVREKAMETNPAVSDKESLPEVAANKDYRSLCPICGERIIISVLSPTNGKRFLHCTLCDHEWSTNRVGCIICGNEDAFKQSYLQTQEFPGIEMVSCELCKQYVKEFDLRVISVQDYLWEDIKSLPLNYATELWLAELAEKSGQPQ